MVIFNGGNNNLYIQFNFIIVSIFFLLFIREKNYLAHIVEIFSKNKIAIFLFTLFISFLIFQIIPLPMEWLSFFSPEKYKILNNVKIEKEIYFLSLSKNKIFFFLNELKEKKQVNINFIRKKSRTTIQSIAFKHYIEYQLFNVVIFFKLDEFEGQFLVFTM